MLYDPEAILPLRRKLEELVQQQVSGLVTGNFPDLASLERHRGVIVGLGMALDVLTPQPAAPHTEEENDESTNQNG